MPDRLLSRHLPEIGESIPVPSNLFPDDRIRGQRRTTNNRVLVAATVIPVLVVSVGLLGSFQDAENDSNKVGRDQAARYQFILEQWNYLQSEKDEGDTVPGMDSLEGDIRISWDE